MAGSNMRCCWFLASLALLSVLPSAFLPIASAQGDGARAVMLRCSPCIERPTYRIRGIVHGIKSSSFWQEVRAAARQSARDLRVLVDIDLNDDFDPRRMARDIRAAATQWASAGVDAADALLVTIPSTEVEDAVRDAVATGIPVFGLNSGYQAALDLGVLGFVAMDEYGGGRMAAEQVLLARSNITQALVVNPQKGNYALDQRFRGFQDGLRMLPLGGDSETDTMTHNNVDDTKAKTRSDVVVRELVVGNEHSTHSSTIKDALGIGCGKYDAILLTSSSALKAATAALDANGCVLGTDQAPLLATFDVGSSVYDAIAVGKVAFAISQQHHLQGVLSVAMATLYATTRKTLAPTTDSDSGVYLSGPALINLANLPSDTQQTCENDAFPVCPNTLVPDGSRESDCECTDRRTLKLGGVVHGMTTDVFWDIVFAAAHQAADDMDIELDFPRFEPQDDANVFHAKMASKMISLCEEGVDGLFVSLPSENVVEAIQRCQELNIPIVSINSGSELSSSLGLMHHISQNEYQAGKSAGKRLIASGMKRGICLMHEQFNSGLIERCNGFRDAIMEASTDVSFLGAVDVPYDSVARHRKFIEDTISEDGDWEGIGLLVFNRIPEALALQEHHPKLLVGTFDTSNEIFNAIEEGKLLFGIDQEPYLQGYMPVVLLTWFAYTQQKLTNRFIESGPAFVEAPPSEDLRSCVANHFKVCPEPVEYELNQIDAIRPLGFALFSIITASSIFFLAWVAWNRNTHVVRGSQPIFLVMIIVGTFIMGTAIIPLSIDDSIASKQGCDIACMTTPWLFFMGFTVAFSALFSKTWRINKLMSSAKRFKRVKVLPKDVILPFLILLAMNVALLLTWTLIDPVSWERKSKCGSSELESYGSCVMGDNGSVPVAACVVAVNIFSVLLANYQAYCARKIKLEYNESKYVAIIMVTILQISIIGIPVLFLVTDAPSAKFFVKTGLIFVLCMSILLLIFVPKATVIRKQKKFQEERSAGSDKERRERLRRASLASYLVVIEDKQSEKTTVCKEADDSVHCRVSGLPFTERERGLRSSKTSVSTYNGHKEKLKEAIIAVLKLESVGTESIYQKVETIIDEHGSSKVAFCDEEDLDGHV